MEPRSIERGKPIVQKRRLRRRAASMEPRSIERGKRAIAGQLRPLGRASMEPRSIERGKEAGRRPFRLPPQRFNGAAIN